MHIHIVGVAGTGMGSLAGLLCEAGHRVTGSDRAFDPPMGPALEAFGVECLSGFDAANLHPAPDLVVIGNVCRPDNVEARAAFDLGLPTTHIAGALQRFVLEGTSPLVVTGTHGKTTTASLCAWLLDRLGLKPGFFIGGIAENFGRGFRLPEAGSPMVMEGDEYDTAYFEKSAKFLHYRSRNAILTSVEHDHVDIYPTQASYHEAFARFLAGLPHDGFLVANADDPHVRSLVAAHARCDVEWYGVHPEHATWRIEAHSDTGRHQVFSASRGGSTRATAELPLPGLHNAKNALAAIVAAHRITGLSPQVIATELAAFKGSKRRQELLGAPAGVHVYDDFAHHPSAVRETLRALRSRHPDGRLFAAFEPRSATACRKLHQADYAEAFDAADLVLLAPVARVELAPDERLSTAELAAALQTRGIDAQAFDGVPALAERLTTESRRGDTIALLSNGSFGGIHATVIGALASRE